MIEANLRPSSEEKGTAGLESGARRTFVRVRGGRLLVNVGQGRPPLALEKLHGRLLGVTATWDSGRPDLAIAAHWRCAAKLRTPALGDVFVETDTLSTTPFVGMVGGLAGARLWSFVAFTATLAPRRGEGPDETPSTFLNVWIDDGESYLPALREGFPESLKTGYCLEKAEAARRLIPSLPAYMDPLELGILPLPEPTIENDEPLTPPDPLPSAFGVPTLRWPRSLTRSARPSVLNAAIRRLEAKGFVGSRAWRASNAILRELGVAEIPEWDVSPTGGQAMLVGDFLENADARALARLRDATVEPKASAGDDPFANE